MLNVLHTSLVTNLHVTQGKTSIDVENDENPALADSLPSKTIIFFISMLVEGASRTNDAMSKLVLFHKEIHQTNVRYILAGHMSDPNNCYMLINITSSWFWGFLSRNC